MSRRSRGGVAAVALVSVVAVGLAGTTLAGADAVAGIDETVNAQTTLATLQQTVTIPPGTFVGTTSELSGKVKGTLKLPAASTTVSLAGIGLVTATFELAPTKKVTGKLLPPSPLFRLKATSTFNIDVVSVEPLGLPVNLAGSHCSTSKPVTLKFSGRIGLTTGGKVSGTYTIPPLSKCGAITLALNEVLAGPGNTFAATLTPSSD